MLHYRNVSKVRDSHHKATYQHLKMLPFFDLSSWWKIFNFKKCARLPMYFMTIHKKHRLIWFWNSSESQSLVFTCTTKSLCKSLLDLICSCVAVLLSETPSRFHTKMSRVNHRRVNLDLKTLKHLEVDLAREEFNKLDIGNIISIWKIHFMLELPSKDGEKNAATFEKLTFVSDTFAFLKVLANAAVPRCSSRKWWNCLMFAQRLLFCCVIWIRLDPFTTELFKQFKHRR